MNTRLLHFMILFSAFFVDRSFVYASESCSSQHQTTSVAQELLEQASQVRQATENFASQRGLDLSHWDHIKLIEEIQRQLQIDSSRIWAVKEAGVLRYLPPIYGRISRIEMLENLDPEDPFPLPAYRILLSVVGADLVEISTRELDLGAFSSVVSFVPISDENARLDLSRRRTTR